MTYQETLDYLYNQLPMFQRIGNQAFKKSLDNIIALCELLDNPHLKFKSVHVAGTNGKGSTSHSLASVLQAAGYKTGLYTSPHLKSFTERVRINGVEISQQAVINFVKNNKEHFDIIQPSFFEMTVALAFHHFAQEKVDIAVIEVGLGGRLDSTNILTPILSVITNISYDHQDLLGNTLPEIAYEKAGIIKKNIPVVISEKQIEVEHVFIQKAKECNAALTFASDIIKITPLENKENLQSATALYQASGKVLNFTYELAGQYQLKNLSGILMTIDLLRNMGYTITDDKLIEGLSNVVNYTGLKGRWQVIRKLPLVICDTAHNESGLKQVMEQLTKLKYNHLHMVLGMVSDKDHTKVLPILPKEANYYFCQANIPRALNALKLSDKAKTYGLNGVVIPDINNAIKAALNNAKPDDAIFIGGSTFVVAEIDELHIQSFVIENPI